MVVVAVSLSISHCCLSFSPLPVPNEDLSDVLPDTFNVHTEWNEFTVRAAEIEAKVFIHACVSHLLEAVSYHMVFFSPVRIGGQARNMDPQGLLGYQCGTWFVHQSFLLSFASHIIYRGFFIIIIRCKLPQPTSFQHLSLICKRK